MSRVYAEGGEVSPEELVGLGVLKNTKSPLKILGRGSLSVSENDKAQKFSATAIKKIEAAGGKCIGLDEMAKKNPKGSGLRLMG